MYKYLAPLLLTLLPSPGLSQPLHSCPPGLVCSTFSLQPLQAFQSAFGGRLVKIAAYSAETCNNTTFQFSRSQGFIRQLAGSYAGINVVDFSLQSPTAARAQAHSHLSLLISLLKWSSVGLSVGSGGVAVLSNQTDIKVPAKITGIAAAASAVFQGIEIPLDAAQKQAEATAATVLASMLDPTRMMLLFPGTCEEHGFFGEYQPKFLPVTAVLQ